MKIAVKILSTAAILGFSSWVQAGTVEQLHQFLQTTKTIRADFSQIVVAKNGRKPQQSSGSVAISRPGKLRWDIEKPYPQSLIGDGERFWIYDPELKQVTVRKVGQTMGGSPAALLSGSNDLEKNFTLKEAGELEGLSWVEAIPRSHESGFEKVRLGFSGSELRGMELHDNFGQTTHIRFSGMARNPAIAASTFKFVPPAGVDVVGE